MRYKWFLISVFFILIIFGGLFGWLLYDINSQLDENKETDSTTIKNNLEITYLNTMNELNHLLVINREMLKNEDKTLSNDFFIKFNQFDTLQIKDALENIRFSPLIYNEELEEHEIIGGTIYPNYTVHNRINFYNFTIPIFNSDPPFFDPSFNGFDLYNFEDLKNSFFDNILEITDNNLISRSIPFLRSEHEFDRGVYLGKFLTNGECKFIEANTFQELVHLNKNTNCIRGFVYIPFLISKFINEMINKNIDQNNRKIYEQLEYIVYDDIENEILYFRRAWSTIY